MLSRRDFIYSSAAASLALGSSVAFGAAASDKRLVIILQRGGQDGLHALPPFAEPSYRAARPKIAIPSPGTDKGALKLNGTFGLHPGMGGMAELYRKGELLAVPAVATRYRRRSHFDGQDFLENGSGKPSGARSGFLNRALAGLPQSDQYAGLNVGLTPPLILAGDQPTQTFAPSNFKKPRAQFLELLADNYESDPALATALATALAQDLDADLSRQEVDRVSRGGDSVATAEAIAPFLARPDGPRVTVIESPGWDTHNGIVNQGRRLLAGLSKTVETLAVGMAPVWDKTLVITVSEFGRTVRQNGGQGSDHGTGGTMFLAGGAVRGGRVVGEWPGLRNQDLYQERDVYPANSTEAVLKAALIEHLGISEGHVEDVVFPGSREISPFAGLFRNSG